MSLVDFMSERDLRKSLRDERKEAEEARALIAELGRAHLAASMVIQEIGSLMATGAPLGRRNFDFALENLDETQKRLLALQTRCTEEEV